MKKTLKLISINTVQTEPFLFLNWAIYALALLAFHTLWVLFPEKLTMAMASGQTADLAGAGLIGLAAAISLFLSIWLNNNAWMKINRIRYHILLNLLKWGQGISSHFLRKKICHSLPLVVLRVL